MTASCTKSESQELLFCQAKYITWSESIYLGWNMLCQCAGTTRYFFRICLLLQQWCSFSLNIDAPCLSPNQMLAGTNESYLHIEWRNAQNWSGGFHQVQPFTGSNRGNCSLTKLQSELGTFGQSGSILCSSFFDRYRTCRMQCWNKMVVLSQQ